MNKLVLGLMVVAMATTLNAAPQFVGGHRPGGHHRPGGFGGAPGGFGGAPGGFGAPGAGLLGTGGGTAGGVGTGSIGPNGQTNAGALSNAHAQPGGVALGQSLGVAINLPALGIQQTFGQGNGIAVGK